MSDTHASNQRIANYVQRNIVALKPLLEPEEPFCAWDVDIDSQAFQIVIQEVSEFGIVEKVGRRGRVDDHHSTRYVNEYKFTEGVRELAQEVMDRTDKLPCGHPSHICNPRTIDDLSCRHCREEPKTKTIPVVEPVFSEQEVQEAL